MPNRVAGLPFLDLIGRLHARGQSVVPISLAPRMTMVLGPAANAFVFAHDELFNFREAFASLIPVDGETALIVSDGPDDTSPGAGATWPAPPPDRRLPRDHGGGSGRGAGHGAAGGGV